MVGRLKIGNGPIITQDKILYGSCLLVENGKILAIEPADTSFPESRLIDTQGHYISPGFMDIHLQKHQESINQVVLLMQVV